MIKATTPIAIAAMIAPVKPLTCIPGRKRSAIIRTMAATMMLMMAPNRPAVGRLRPIRPQQPDQNRGDDRDDESRRDRAAKAADRQAQVQPARRCR